jgi:hypothetical protein
MSWNNKSNNTKSLFQFQKNLVGFNVLIIFVDKLFRFVFV